MLEMPAGTAGVSTERTSWLASAATGTSLVAFTVPSRSMNSAFARSPSCRAPLRFATWTEPSPYEYRMCTGSLAFFAPKYTPAWSRSYPYSSHCNDGHALFICQ